MIDRKYLVETTVTGAEDMWNFVQAHRVVVRSLANVQADLTTKCKYELIMCEQTATLFVLTAAPCSCIERIE
jgi:hypothetical protein